MVIKLLLARCSDSEVLQDLARRLGVKETPFEPEYKNCILCGRCVRVCQKAVGPAAISWADRGVDRKIVFPFYETPDTCIGCGACAYVCPIETIKLEDGEDTRTLTIPNPKMPKAEFKLRKCPTCGSYWASEKELDYIARNLDLAPEILDSCLDCREKALLMAIWPAKEAVSDNTS
jgi:ferredoxin